MLRNKFIKIPVSALLMLLALWVAVPKVYIHDLLHHDHAVLTADSETKLQSQSGDDCDFNEYNKPVYFNIFKFISSFIPLKPQNEIKKIGRALSLSSLSHVVSFLRGPPVTE
ncbi:MAG: hypothetical protein V4635_14335 [Bacteroidota bacterium]